MNQLIANVLSLWNDPTAIGALLLLSAMICISIATVLIITAVANAKRKREWPGHSLINRQTPAVNSQHFEHVTYTGAMPHKPSEWDRLTEQEIRILLDREIG